MTSRAILVVLAAFPVMAAAQGQLPGQPPVETRSIQVRVVSNDSWPSIDLLLASASGRVVKTRKVHTNDTTEFPLLLPGRYLARARAVKQGRADAACQIVDVSEGDATVDLPLAAGGHLHGWIVNEEGRIMTADGLHVVAALADGTTDVDPLARDSAPVNETGGFLIEGLCGERLVRVQGLPAGWQQRDVQWGGASVPTLTVDPGADVDNVLVVVGPVR